MAKPDLCRVEGLAATQAHQVERLLRGEYRAMASARVVGMTMRDHGLVHGPCGVGWEPPILQYTPAGVGKRISSGRMGLRYGVNGAMTGGPLLSLR